MVPAHRHGLISGSPSFAFRWQILQKGALGSLPQELATERPATEEDSEIGRQVMVCGVLLQVGFKPIVKRVDEEEPGLFEQPVVSLEGHILDFPAAFSWRFVLLPVLVIVSCVCSLSLLSCRLSKEEHDEEENVIWGAFLLPSLSLEAAAVAFSNIA